MPSDSSQRRASSEAQIYLAQISVGASLALVHFAFLWFAHAHFGQNEKKKARKKRKPTKIWLAIYFFAGMFCFFCGGGKGAGFIVEGREDGRWSYSTDPRLSVCASHSLSPCLLCLRVFFTTPSLLNSVLFSVIIRHSRIRRDRFVRSRIPRTIEHRRK